jgi:3-vinyl bacteriochlorophyllide hydratase
MFAPSVFGRMMDSVDCAPWGASAGRHVGNEAAGYSAMPQRSIRPRPLYTPEEKRRRDATPWTRVQGILAPVQFLVFAVSLSLVVRYLLTGGGEHAAMISVVVKTFCLYTIMVTGAIWERKVFGMYLFAPAFFWEDAVSMIVIALHTAYLAALVSGSLDTQSMMFLALAAYATYVANAAQFVLKLRAARLSEERWAYNAGQHGLEHA